MCFIWNTSTGSVKVKTRSYPTDERKIPENRSQSLLTWGTFSQTQRPHGKQHLNVYLKNRNKNSGKLLTWGRLIMRLKAKDDQCQMLRPSLTTSVEVNAWHPSTFVPDFGYVLGHPESHDACRIITPHGICVPTRVRHGLKITSAYLQPAIPPLFDGMQHSFKACIDDVIVHAWTEGGLIKYLVIFFEIW